MQAVLTHFTSPRFWACYDALPHHIQELADSRFELLKKSPRHPSLHFKRIDQFWSVRVGLHYRALGVAVESGVVWFWIGAHAEYDRLIS